MRIGESSRAAEVSKVEQQSTTDKQVGTGYSKGSPAVADDFVCQKSDFFKVSDSLSRSECKAYLETTMADRGLRALAKAPANVKGPLTENMKTFKSLGYSDKDVACMSFAVLQKLGMA